jgi:uncharacterized membrane protein YbhN (UPF0104 family)
MRAVHDGAFPEGTCGGGVASVSLEPNPRRRHVLRLVLTWGGTALILTYMAFTTDLQTAWEAARGANHLLFGATLVLSTVGAYVVDSATVVVLLRRVGVRVGLGEFLLVKGASYLLNIFNYNLALVMMAAVVKRRSTRGWGASGSPFLLLNFVDLSVFGGFVVVATVSGQSPFQGTLEVLVGLPALAATAAPLVLCGFARCGSVPGIVGTLANHGLLAAFRHLRLADLPLVTALRCVLVLVLVTMYKLCLHAFGTDIPLASLLVYMAAMIIVGMVPVTVGGLGSSQVVARGFFGPYVPTTVAATQAARESVVDAMSTSVIVFTMVLRCGIGLACLPWVSRTFTEEPPPGEEW